MASFASTHLVTRLVLLFSLFCFTSATRRLTESTQDQNPDIFQYHNGPLLSGKISINLIWYGNFKPSQRAIISDFIASLSSTSKPMTDQPSVATWWKNTEKYYYNRLINSKKASSLGLSTGNQVLDENYSMGKSLTSQQIERLAAKGDQYNAINVVLTSSDVIVDGFCSSRCGTHGSSKSAQSPRDPQPLPDLATEIVIPVCTVVGIVFSLVQCFLVSQVKLSARRNASSTTKNKSGYTNCLIAEEEGVNEHNVVAKCAEIQNAISEERERRGRVRNEVVKMVLFPILLHCSIWRTSKSEHHGGLPLQLLIFRL